MVRSRAMDTQKGPGHTSHRSPLRTSGWAALIGVAAAVGGWCMFLLSMILLSLPASPGPTRCGLPVGSPVNHPGTVG